VTIGKGENIHNISEGGKKLLCKFMRNFKFHASKEFSRSTMTESLLDFPKEKSNSLIWRYCFTFAQIAL